jgi:hypothetical protein
VKLPRPMKPLAMTEEKEVFRVQQKKKRDNVTTCWTKSEDIVKEVGRNWYIV